VGDVLVSGTVVNVLSTCGPLCVCKTEEEALQKFRRGDILVLPKTTNATMPLIRQASGIVTEMDGVNSHAAIAAMAVLYFVQGTVGMLALVGLIGFACSSIFSVIYSTALKCHPEKANEISGLMITGVCGGAVIPPLMGFTTDLLGSQTGSLLVISACMLYLAGCALALRRFAAK
jgi:phosphohistidine swiveling domain-containing protein